jgi:voltage-gated potassium channel
MSHDPIVGRIVLVLLSLLGILVCGTVGYAWIEGWSWSDGLFMTTITTSTVGYGETHSLSPLGRSFTSVLIAVSVLVMTCWNAALTSFVVDGDISGRYARRKTLKMISNLNQHTIVCGTTNMALAVIERLIRKRMQVVVVSEDKEQLALLQRTYRKLFTVEGNATSELILAQANVTNAAAVVAALDGEVDNLLVGITCKDLGTTVSVLARSETPDIANRMRKAGIDEVICPPQICGDRVAQVLVANAAAAAAAEAGE